MAEPRSLSPARVALIGMLSIGTAMGIGRFAFTPILPLMQQSQHVSLADGAWLATVNYLGYLIGAVAGVVRPAPPARAIRGGLLAVALSTIAMAFTTGMPAWLALRFVAGVASAFVLFGVSGWALVRLGAAGRGDLGGWVFAGVGIGIATAGVLALVVGTVSGAPEPAWALLGVASASIIAFAWSPLAAAAPAAVSGPIADTTPLDRHAWMLVLCYGIFGLGYIVPATFLPALARGLVNDPAVFGWTWPVFGLAAALSVIAVSRFLGHVPPRVICGVGMVIASIGTAAPVFHLSIGVLIFSAVCVGGTFVVITLAAIQEARRLTGGPAARLIAGMTSAFAVGQLIGPLLAHAGPSVVTAMRMPSIIASSLNLVAALVLLIDRPRAGKSTG